VWVLPRRAQATNTRDSDRRLRQTLPLYTNYVIFAGTAMTHANITAAARRAHAMATRGTASQPVTALRLNSDVDRDCSACHAQNLRPAASRSRPRRCCRWLPLIRGGSDLPWVSEQQRSPTLRSRAWHQDLRAPGPSGRGPQSIDLAHTLVPPAVPGLQRLSQHDLRRSQAPAAKLRRITFRPDRASCVDQLPKGGFTPAHDHSLTTPMPRFGHGLRSTCHGKGADLSRNGRRPRTVGHPMSAARTVCVSARATNIPMGTAAPPAIPSAIRGGAATAFQAASRRR